jgi:hypothetical protein
MSIKITMDKTEADAFLANSRNNMLNNVAAALNQSLGDVVDVAKANAMRTMKMHSGDLVNSLVVLQIRFGTDKVEIDIGSDLSGYPFYQEYGWTTRTERRVPAKFYFSSAVWSTLGKVNDDVAAYMATKAGG